MNAFSFLLGFVLPFLLAWLICVYPYSDISLRQPLLWLGKGILTGLVCLIAILVAWACGWKRD